MIVTPSVLELVHRSRNLDRALALSNLLNILKFLHLFWFKSYLVSKILIITKFLTFSQSKIAHVWPQIHNLHPTISGTGIVLLLFITCQNFIEIFATMFARRYVCLSVCLLSFCLSVCLFGTRYRSQFFNNRHQTWSTYEVMYREEPYSFSRSKVK